MYAYIYTNLQYIYIKKIYINLTLRCINTNIIYDKEGMFNKNKSHTYKM